MAAGGLSGALRAGAAFAGACLLAHAHAQAWAQAGNSPCSAHAQPTTACTAQAFAEADETIAVLYADVRRALSAHERPQLRQEHTAWLRERSLKCPAPPKLATTDDALAQQQICLTRETQARRKGLMSWLSASSPATLP